MAPYPPPPPPAARRGNYVDEGPTKYKELVRKADALDRVVKVVGCGGGEFDSPDDLIDHIKAAIADAEGEST